MNDAYLNLPDYAGLHGCHSTKTTHRITDETALKGVRQNQTDAEKAMWRLMRDRQLNGDQHAAPAQMEYDQVRSTTLAEQGIRVLRFSNSEMLVNPQGVLQAIADALEARYE